MQSATAWIRAAGLPRQVRVAAEVDARIQGLPADRHVKASDIIREALATEVSRGGKAAPRTQSADALAPTNAVRVRTPAKAAPAAAPIRISANAKTTPKRSGLAAQRSAKTA
jgi:hypothetical protein